MIRNPPFMMAATTATLVQKAAIAVSSSYAPARLLCTEASNVVYISVYIVQYERVCMFFGGQGTATHTAVARCWPVLPVVS